MSLPSDVGSVTKAIINLDALAANFRLLRDLAGRPAEMMVVVKADAYGHGAVEVSRRLLELGAWGLVVATAAEAIELRRCFPDARLMIIGSHLAEELPALVRAGVRITLTSYDDAVLVSRQAERDDLSAEVHIELDTGMGRTGVPVSEAADTVARIGRLANLRLEGIYTHLSTADEEDLGFSRRQLALFAAAVGELENRGIRFPMRHVANTAAIARMPESCLNAVRPGIGLYGLAPSQALEGKLALAPVMRLVTKIVFLKDVPAGCPISYGRTFTTRRPSRIATLPVGYADGYARGLSGTGTVTIHGQEAPVAGTVCMDMTMVDVTDIPQAAPGDEVVLYSDRPDAVNCVEAVARLLGTIPYEVTCAVSRRVERVYVGGRPGLSSAEGP